MPDQTTRSRTSTLFRVAFEYGQTWCASSTSFSASARSRPGSDTSKATSSPNPPSERGPMPTVEVTLPPNFISPDVPHDVPAGSGATIQELAIFAWQEFIALNWVASDLAASGLRGRPNTAVGFLDIAPDNGSFPLVVWQTYRHKNQLFPIDGTTDASFDSHMPTYNYMNNPKMGTGVNGQIPSFSLFNNLDETSQIGVANMYAHSTSVSPEAQPASGIRVAYEAKVNRAVFQYLVNSGFTSPTGGYAALTKAQLNTGTVYGDQNIPNVGICSPPLAPARRRSSCCLAAISTSRATWEKARSKSRRRGAH
jgi:hypothetical protein